MPEERITQRIRNPRLSATDLRALEIASQGLSMKETAAKLGIPVNTVASRLRHARWALGAFNTTHAVATALRRGLIT